MGWSLDSVYDRNKESPYTFYVPSRAVIDFLTVGDMVKLIFLSDEEHEDYCGERMWVEITQREGEAFVGTLANKPVYISSLQYGQEIRFTPEHICDTMYDDPESQAWDFYFDKKVIVSNDVLERREFNFLMRDNPENENDTGWIIFSGFEDDDDNDNSDNFQVISIGVILNIDDSILTFIHDKPLCAYERDFEKGIFVKVDDFDWESYLNG